MRRRTVIFWLVAVGLLLAGLLLTTARAFEPAGGWWVRLEAFTPLGIVCYGAALLVLGAGFVHRRQAARAGGVVLALAGLALHGWWYAPMLAGANPPAPDGAETLTVMTANMYLGEGDGLALVAAASEEDVDLLVVQEITPGLLATMEGGGLEDLFPHQTGVPTDDGDGTMIFAREPLDDVRRLATTWGGWEVTTDGLTLLGVHPVSPVQVAEWRRDHAVVLDAAVASDVDLVVGDLNATTDHEPMRRLADEGYRSATELANEGWQPTWPAHGRTSLMGVPLPHLVQIDHVLLGPSLAAVGTRTLDIPGTDHRALVAEVAVK